MEFAVKASYKYKTVQMIPKQSLKNALDPTHVVRLLVVYR